MIITCEAQTFLPHQPYGLGCATMSGTIVTSSRNGEVQVYSPSLQLVSSFELKDKVDKIRISPAGDYVGVCLRNRVLVLTVDGKTVKSIPQQDWDTYATGDCSFFPDNRFWMIHPIASDKFQIDVFDTKSWNVVASDHFCLDEQCVFRFIPHPEGRLVAVWAGAGQDGAWLTFTKFQNDHIKVLQEPQIWTFPPVFHPGGGEFLEINDGELSRYSFPEVNLLGNQLLQSQTFGEQDGFDGFVQYVADDKAILASANGWLRLIDLSTMSPIDDASLQEEPLRFWHSDMDETDAESTDITQIQLIKDNHFLAVHSDWMDNPANPNYTLKIWNATVLSERLTGPAADHPFTSRFEKSVRITGSGT